MHTQVRYLQEDATEALAHIRMALRAAAAHASVDLPPGDASAPADTITLPRGDLLLSGLEGGVWDLDEDWGAEGGGGAGAGLGAGLVLGGGRFGVLDLAISMPSGSARLSNVGVVHMCACLLWWAAVVLCAWGRCVGPGGFLGAAAAGQALGHALGMLGATPGVVRPNLVPQCSPAQTCPGDMSAQLAAPPPPSQALTFLHSLHLPLRATHPPQTHGLQDLSEVFGMGFSSQEDERFDEAMEGLEPFDLNDLEVERLRAAPSTPAGALWLGPLSICLWRTPPATAPWLCVHACALGVEWGAGAFWPR